MEVTYEYLVFSGNCDSKIRIADILQRYHVQLKVKGDGPRGSAIARPRQEERRERSIRHPSPFT